VKTWKLLLAAGTAGLVGGLLLIAATVALINHYGLTI
jgi:hypothetical protein